MLRLLHKLSMLDVLVAGLVTLWMAGRDLESSGVVLSLREGCWALLAAEGCRYTAHALASAAILPSSDAEAQTKVRATEVVEVRAATETETVRNRGDPLPSILGSKPRSPGPPGLDRQVNIKGPTARSSGGVTWDEAVFSDRHAAAGRPAGDGSSKMGLAGSFNSSAAPGMRGGSKMGHADSLNSNAAAGTMGMMGSFNV
jgi:hypothetical protein